METIKDILSEMLEMADAENGILAIHAPRLADRIEEAVKALEADRDNWRNQALAEDERANATQPVINCNGFKMRNTVVETEKRIDKVVSILTEIPNSCGYGGLLKDAADELCGLKEEFVKPALAESPRNCDLYETENETLKAFHATYPISTYYLYVKWLFAEAKGETK